MQYRQDVFIEQLVRKRKDAKDWGLIALYVFLYFVLLFLMLLFFKYIYLFAFIIFAFATWGLYYLIVNRNIEYEYICTNGHVDIDCIYNKKKRKRKVSMAATKMEILAKVDDPEFERYKEKKEYKYFDYSSNTGENQLWFFAGKYKEDLVLVLFEPEMRIIEDCRRFNPRAVKYNPIQG